MSVVKQVDHRSQLFVAEDNVESPLGDFPERARSQEGRVEGIQGDTSCAAAGAVAVASTRYIHKY